MNYVSFEEILDLVDGTEDKRLYEPIGEKNYFVNISAKDHTSELIAESHTYEDDIYIVKEGEADLYLGGEIFGSKEVTDGQLRGTNLVGDITKQRIYPGDMVFIPATTPHMLDARNDTIKLVVVKIIKKA